ncbi:MAG: hypothetical protein F7B95_00045 [Desulfurococcales archaeon]|nr:hypothetical protein [Desulfurococcales archaeon]
MVEATNATLNIIDLVTSEPKVAAAILIQLLLGLALGYISAKIAKYIFAFIAIIIIGVLLNVWSLGGSVEDILLQFGEQAKLVKDFVFSLVTTLGILTIGPVSLGFVIGLLIGIMRGK